MLLLLFYLNVFPTIYLIEFICLFAGKKCNLIDLHRQELERIVNLSDEALRLRVMNLHSYVFLRKQREEKRLQAEKAANGSFYSTIPHSFALIPELSYL
jgi:hypothetical protein